MPKCFSSYKIYGRLFNKVQLCNTELKFFQQPNLLDSVYFYQTSYQQSNIHKTMSTFRISDYDCIGFDLDSTILRYNISNLVQLEYDVITKFLVDKKGYNAKHLTEPLSQKDFDFLQKGLFLDFEKGNVVKLSPNGNVYLASHGTNILSNNDIEKYYPNREWKIGKMFTENPLLTWNGPLSLKIRTVMDYFDMISSLVFARVVNSLDTVNGKTLQTYNIWPDILEALSDMYSREQLTRNAGWFYSELKKNPAKYIHKCHTEILAWIQKIKQKKTTYLITGSNSDFAEFTTGYAFGKCWKSLFDIIVCYAKKPAFFMEKRPFYSVKNYYEDRIVTSKELERGKIYNQGNWKELYEFFTRITDLSNPKCLYIGDNLLQDIFAPTNHANCDTIVISEEQLAEKMLHHSHTHSDEHVLNSKIWGSFFTLKDSTGYTDSFWSHIIKKNSKLCIPQLDVITNVPLDKPLSCFVKEDNDKELKGYHPAKPITLSYL
ncbi:5'-nucleotidase domain-containing protein 1 [Copidosoma floridanum]|uniref:5'-nucleotidase domain-containing protein 1 n=1 Tax=Copidosoma floridanum TaxID=29053 RepID=UPI0006C98A86|nr:5'-nucleotidase domain-containing protein 1 [Copidosoma floridanum]